ncbi:MAG TPA: hypothetical protein VFL92_04710 [Sphingomonas sp.]|nr:hypothetical protein [Sphingomonas sp.]
MQPLAKISLGALWEETAAFLRAELALVAPVALLCFGLPMIVLLLAMPVPADGRLQPGPWLWWLLPCGLLSMLGSLSVSALALRPGASVRECLAMGLKRMPTAIGLELLNAALQAALALPIALAALAEGSAGGEPGPASLIANLAGLAFIIWLYVRVLPIWALLSERPMTPFDALRGSFRATRGRYGQLLLLRIVGAVAGFIALMVLVLPIDALFALLGRLPGLSGIANLLGFIATGAVVAALMAIWTVYVARLYRRLEGSISGT